MSKVRSHGHRGRFFASLRLGVLAINVRTVVLKQRDEWACGDREYEAGFSDGSEVSFSTPKRKGAKTQRESRCGSRLTERRMPVDGGPAYRIFLECSHGVAQWDPELAFDPRGP
jgi:hypothetical protein